MKSRARTFSSNEKMDRLIDELVEVNGFSGVTTLIHMLVADAHKKRFPSYFRPIGVGAMTPEEAGKVKYQIKNETKKAEEADYLNEKKNICENVLYGNVLEDEEGNLVCEYNNFHPEGEYKQIIPLKKVNKDLALNLFIPTKKAVLKKRPELVELLGLDEEQDDKLELKA